MNNPVDQPKVSELLPCPFCGAQLEIRESANAYGRHAKDSECIMAAYAVNIPHDVERWNARALPQPQATTVGVTEPPEMALLRGPLSKRATSAEFNEWQAREIVAYVDRLRSALIGIPGAEKGEAVAWRYWDPLEQQWYVTEKRRVQALPNWHETPLYAAPTSERVQAPDTVIWELEAAQRSHYQHFEGDSSGLINDTERAKANNRLWAAIEAVLSAYVAPTSNAAKLGATGPTYYTEGKDADWFEGLDDAEFAKRASHAAMDIADGDFACIENYVPVVAIISLAADRITRLLSPPRPNQRAGTGVGVGRAGARKTVRHGLG